MKVFRNNLDGAVYAGERSWRVPLRSNDNSKSWVMNSSAFNPFDIYERVNIKYYYIFHS